MDPVSITCTVGAITRTVFNISWTLTRFIKDTKGVNQSVKDLAVEVSNLINALKAVQSGLNDPVIRNAEAKADKADSLELWRSVNGSLLNTRATVDRLDEALETIREDKTNFAKQAMRQLKLNLKQDEITAIRAQFRTHISALQMTLLMMNVRATCMTSEITAELGPKIEKLGGMIEELKQDIQVSRTLNDVDHVPQLISAKHAERLNKTAQKILSSASTMYSQSEWGGSVFGEVLDDLSRQRMHEWIPPAPLAEESVSQTTLSEQFSPHSGESIFSEGEKKSVLSTDPTEMLSLVDEDDDTGGEFDFEVVERFLLQGAKAAAQEDFEAATTFINAGHAQSETLTLEQKQKLDLRGSQLLLARCNYRSGNLDSAELQLVTYAERYPPTPDDSTAIQACEASHLLSQVYLRKGKVSAARAHCRKAMIGRRRILGKEHVTYFESLYLLAEICEVSNSAEEAEVYLDMIPEDIKTTFVKVSVPKEVLGSDGNGQPGLRLVPPSNGQAMHASKLFDFDSLDPQPEYVPSVTQFLASPTSGDLARNWSSNNPFRRRPSSQRADVIQRAQTNAALSESRPQPTEPETSPQNVQRTQSNGVNPTAATQRSSSSAGATEPDESKQGPSPETLDQVDWSLLWRFATKVDISLLPPELLQGANKTKAPLPKFITSSMLKKASTDTLHQLALSLASPAATTISPLHLAACVNHKELALRLLEREFYDVNQKCSFYSSDEPLKDSVGNTPLHCAAQYGRTDMTKFLLEEGADASIKNQAGYTPLLVAIAFGQLDVISQLYNPNSFIPVAGETTPLHVAAKYQRTAIMQVLLESWSDLDIEDADGFTALHIASDANASDCVEELLQRGADTEALDSRTSTALHLATKKGHVRTVQRLLSYNAQVDAKTNKGETALHLSVRHRQVQVFRKLLGYGADVDVQNYEGITALYLAVDDRQRGTIDTLIQRGASLELQEVGTKKRPLHAAVLRGDADIVRMLLRAGAQTSVVDSKNRSPLDISETLRYTEIRDALRQASEVPQRQAADTLLEEDSNKIALAANNQEASPNYIPRPEAHNRYEEQPGLEVSFAEQVRWPYHHRHDWATAPDWTPLHRAAYLGQKELVISLIGQGASITKQTREGYTARGLAAIQNNVAIEAFLEGLEMRGPSIRSKFSRLFVKDEAR